MLYMINIRCLDCLKNSLLDFILLIIYNNDYVDVDDDGVIKKISISIF